MDISDLTTEEKKAVTRMGNAMKILAKRHWFYGTAGGLCVMRYDEDGERAFTPDKVMYDQDYHVCNAGDGLDIDGGDW